MSSGQQSRCILVEASAPAELAASGLDTGGQVVQARFALEWTIRKIDTLPLWNDGSRDLPVTDSAAFALTTGEIEEAYFWGALAQHRYPWRDAPAPADSRLAWAWTRGMLDVLAWTCGEAREGPLSGRRVLERPTLHDVSLDACRAMTGVRMAREADDPLRARRMEAIMEMFLWLAGWTRLPPVDRHGHGTFKTCPDREAPCGCDAAGHCLGADCAACWQVPCVQGFGQDGFHTAAEVTNRRSGRWPRNPSTWMRRRWLGLTERRLLSARAG